MPLNKIIILIYAPGALQCIAAKLTIKSKFGQKIRYFDGLNSVLHVFSNGFLLEKREHYLVEMRLV